MDAGLRVLIADDELLAVVTTKVLLESLGWEVVGVARNGAAAVQLAQSLHPDVILMDVQMPEMDGVQATRTLMLEHPTCVVLVSGRECLTELAEQAGAMGCASKPLFLDQVPALVAEATERFQRFLRVAAGASSPEEAVQKWTALQHDVQALCASTGLSEEQAFQQLFRPRMAHRATLPPPPRVRVPGRAKTRRPARPSLTTNGV